MSEVTKEKAVKAQKMADPIAASIDPATQEMIVHAQKLGIETVFDRAVTMKPCAIGMQGTCCKNCAGHVVCRCPRRGSKAKIPEKGCAAPRPIP